MYYYKCNILKVKFTLDYGVPNVDLIEGVKYNNPFGECVFKYPEIVADTENLKQISQEVYEDYTPEVIIHEPEVPVPTTEERISALEDALLMLL